MINVKLEIIHANRARHHFQCSAVQKKKNVWLYLVALNNLLDRIFVCFTCVGPFNHIKSSLLGSTSDSNLNKYSAINKIPLITLNFSEANNEKKMASPPTSEKTMIAPKVKDRAHNVTEKVTQVGWVATCRWRIACGSHHHDLFVVMWFGWKKFTALITSHKSPRRCPQFMIFKLTVIFISE